MSKKILSVYKKNPHWKDVLAVIQTLNKSGHKAWLAGGCVRDALLGKKAKDFDVATSATPEQVESLFSKTIAVGKSFGVIKVITKTVDVEVASFRKDGLYVDGRRPETVEFSSPEEDANRRDFTINALFYAPLEEKVYDFVHGLKDLKSKKIKTVGVAKERFSEDKLRMLRAVRFVSQLGFKLDPEILKAIQDMKQEIHLVSGERLYDEMNKFFSGPNARDAYKLFLKSGLANEIFGITSTKTLPFSKDDNFLNWVIFLKQVPDRSSIYLRLKVSHDFINRVEETLKLCEKLKSFKNLSLAQKRRVAAKDFINLAMKVLKTEKPIASTTASFLRKYKKLPPRLLTSAELIKLGVVPGPQFGEILEKAYDAQLDGQLKNLKQAKHWLKIFLQHC